MVERLHGKVYDHNHRFDRTPSYVLEQPVETGPHIPYDDNHPNNSYSRIKNMRDRLKLMGSNEAMPLPHFLSYELSPWHRHRRHVYRFWPRRRAGRAPFNSQTTDDAGRPIQSGVRRYHYNSCQQQG